MRKREQASPERRDLNWRKRRVVESERVAFSTDGLRKEGGTGTQAKGSAKRRERGKRESETMKRKRIEERTVHRGVTAARWLQGKKVNVLLMRGRKSARPGAFRNGSASFEHARWKDQNRQLSFLFFFHRSGLLLMHTCSVGIVRYFPVLADVEGSRRFGGFSQPWRARQLHPGVEGFARISFLPAVLIDSR